MLKVPNFSGALNQVSKLFKWIIVFVFQLKSDIVANKVTHMFMYC